MKRGEIWTIAGGKYYAAKPRPVVILQDDRFDTTDSITVCAFTTDPTDAPLFRIVVEPNESNGLRAICRLMVDKITTVPKSRIGAHIGRLTDDDMVRLNRAVPGVLGYCRFQEPRTGGIVSLPPPEKSTAPLRYLALAPQF
jgi:mRNA interferase MazF